MHRIVFFFETAIFAHVLCLKAQMVVILYTPIHMYFIFEKSSSTNWFFNLQKSISKLIFAGYTGSKNPVRNRLKIQFVELDFSKLIFQKSSTEQQGVSKI